MEKEQFNTIMKNHDLFLSMLKELNTKSSKVDEQINKLVEYIKGEKATVHNNENVPST